VTGLIKTHGFAGEPVVPVVWKKVVCEKLSDSSGQENEEKPWTRFFSGSTASIFLCGCEKLLAFIIHSH